jgi:alpha-galactosidase
LEGGLKYHATDIWTGGDLGCVDTLQAEVEGHDTVGWLVGEECEEQTLEGTVKSELVLE